MASRNLIHLATQTFNTEGVYKRKRNGRITYDGVLAYDDEHGK